MRRSRGYASLRDKPGGDASWTSVGATLSLAEALGGYVPVRYYMHEAQEGFGRMKSEVMATGLLATPYVRMPRSARAALATEYYWDVDMENCQPSLLEQKLRQHKIACPLLTRYVSDRDVAIAEVMEGCGVSRDDAKRLFLRMMFFGGLRSWLTDVCPHARADGVPSWVHELKRELRDAATLLLRHPKLADLKDAYRRRSVSMETSDAPPSPHLSSAATGHPLGISGDPLASIMAMYLQTLECECVRALVAAVQSDCRAVGGIIYDGVLVEKLAGETAPPDGAQLTAWEDAVREATGLSVRLKAKALDVPPEWLQESTGSDGGAAHEVDGGGEQWMDGRHLLSYEEVKRLWERQAFKVVKSGNYVREDAHHGSRTVMSERQLMESFRHLHYATVDRQDDGTVKVATSQGFVSRWIKDPTIRTFWEMVFAPPPLLAPASCYNIWNGFAVERATTPSPPSVDWGSLPGVRMLVDFRERLLGPAVAKYVLDFEAQMYQFPAKKTGVALVLKGEEGTGKSLLLELHRDMMGRDKFLQTATPATTLYGRFNRPREGRVLIVINEASGSDNFAANDVIKDMITCDEFQSEGKGTNSYTMGCHARFVFTTNNENVLRVNPDSRRYVVVETSSALKGNTEFFVSLARAHADPEVRVAFYRYLMARDIGGVDWINDRPITESFRQMVVQNLPYEHQYFKSLVLKEYHEKRLAERVDSPMVKLTIETLYDGFVAWLSSNHVRYETTRNKFGLRLTKLVRDEEKQTGFGGLGKVRLGTGVTYKLDIRRLVTEMRQHRWLTEDDA